MPWWVPVCTASPSPADDHDEMGVFIEPAQDVLGVGNPLQHFVFRTQPEGAVRAG